MHGLSELFRHSSACDPPELDHSAPSVTLSNLGHSGLVFAVQTAVAGTVWSGARNEPSDEPLGIGFDDNPADTFALRHGTVRVGEEEGMELLDSVDEYVQVDLAAVELDVV